MKNDALFIGGRWRAGGGPRFATRDPWTGEEAWRSTSASPEDVSAAVAAARHAFEAWADLPFAERCAVARRFASVLTEHKAELAEIIGRETGKPRWEAATEVASMIAKVDISITAYNDRTGTRPGFPHRPHGVVAVFGPYNFPGHLPNGHIVPALLAGNTVVFKPSELTPATAVRSVELWEKAGLPAGVLNLVPGEKDTGIALARADIDGLFFTGSAATGTILHRELAGRPERILALEMGGNNPLVIGQVADRRAANFLIVQSAFISAGQRCTCARRLYVPDGPFGETLLGELATIAAHLRVDRHDAEPAPYMGTVITEAAAEKLVDAQEMLARRGGKVLLPMQRKAHAGLTPGLVDVTDVDDLPDEEYFGPLLTVVRYASFDEAIALANRTRFGLAAGLISDEAGEWQRFSRRIRAGIVNWNKQLTGASSAAPFGGIGLSGNHRPSAYYAADYCAYPVASMEAERPAVPAELPPGMSL
jgi:succinylglutamic semialdehyde dehydrogenase